MCDVSSNLWKFVLKLAFQLKRETIPRKQLTFFLVAVRFALKQNTAIPNDSANLPYNQIRHTTCLHAWLGARSHVNIKKSMRWKSGYISRTA